MKAKIEHCYLFKHRWNIWLAYIIKPSYKKLTTQDLTLLFFTHIFSSFFWSTIAHQVQRLVLSAAWYQSHHIAAGRYAFVWHIELKEVPEWQYWSGQMQQPYETVYWKDLHSCYPLKWWEPWLQQRHLARVLNFSTIYSNSSTAAQWLALTSHGKKVPSPIPGLARH